VNSLSHLYVAAHQNEMRIFAANQRLVTKATVGRSRIRLGAAAKSVWSFLSGPADRPSVPTLVNYPYRG
jgi:hypothetical protein